MLRGVADSKLAGIFLVALGFFVDNNLPKHVAIIMDGNGRWARRQDKARIMGHKSGVASAQEIIKASAEKGIQVLSLFAFSSENWNRPEKEVSYLMDLFLKTLTKEAKELHKNKIRLRFIGDRSRFSAKLCHRIQESETLTEKNTGMQLLVAVNYGGRWDIVQATRNLVSQVLAGDLNPDEIDETVFQKALLIADLPEPDLLIRTSGEQRISNFFLWQCAYTELYFTPVLWPDFKRDAFEDALTSYAQRQRRFGLTAEQMENTQHA